MNFLIAQHNNFIQDIETKKIVDEWEKNNKAMTTDKGFKFYKKLGATINGLPVFEFLIKKHGIYPVAETPNNIAFIPAGFNLKKDSTRTLTEEDLSEIQVGENTYINPVQYKYAEKSALMSLLHVLVIPKKRIFNAVTLPGKKYDLEEAKKCGEIALKTLRNGPISMVGSLKFWLNNKNPKWKVNQDDMKSRLPENVNTYKMDIKHSYHVYGNNSVGYLHMHVYDSNLLTKAYEKMDGDNKNTPVEVVQDWLKFYQMATYTTSESIKLQDIVKLKNDHYEKILNKYDHYEVKEIRDNYKNKYSLVLKKLGGDIDAYRIEFPSNVIFISRGPVPHYTTGELLKKGDMVKLENDPYHDLYEVKEFREASPSFRVTIKLVRESIDPYQIVYASSLIFLSRWIRMSKRIQNNYTELTKQLKF